MDALQKGDVPYGNDRDSAAEAATYGESADRERPWRARIREHIAERVAQLAPPARVLELGPVSMQAVHELRHKRHAARLYQQVHEVLAVPGLVLICDHTPFDDSVKRLLRRLPARFGDPEGDA